MSYMRLKENHPVHQKAESLFNLMEDLGLHISMTSSGIRIEDVETDQEFELYDIEANPSNENGVYELPPCTEWILCYDKE